MANKKITCPICGETYISLEGLYDHIDEEHDEDIPEDMSIPQYVYFLRTGKAHGNCIVCKSPTEWNEKTSKYKRFCENPKCKEKYRKQFEKRMINKYGKVSLLNDPDQQRKMLAHRKISGKYKWTDGTTKTYTGSYELDFLKFLDVFMDFESDDVFTPSPHTYYYEYKGEKKFYIPDVWIPSLNLEVEIKESDNTHPHMQVDREKERLKDKTMENRKDVDYIKIVDKKYAEFFKYLAKRKEAFLNKADAVRDEMLTVTESYNDIDEESNLEKTGLTEAKNKHITIPHNLCEGGAIIMAEDILDNYIKINPEQLDIDKLISIRDKNSKNIKKDIIDYCKTLENEYSRHVRENDYYNASIDILHMSNILDKFIGKTYDERVTKFIEDYFIPNDLTEGEMCEWLNRRINKLIEVDTWLSKLLLQNVEYLGLNTTAFKNKLLTMNTNEWIKTLKTKLDDNVGKITLHDNYTTIFDYSQFNGCKVYISNKLIEDGSFNKFIKPSRFLVRSRYYDMIIVTHNVKEYKDNNDDVGHYNTKWSIDPITIDGKTYKYLYDIIVDVENKKIKNILVLSCNMLPVNLNKDFEFKNINIDFIYGLNSEGGNTKGVPIIFESNALQLKNNNIEYYMNLWKYIQDNISKNIIRFRTMVLDKLELLELPIYPDEIKYFNPHTLSIETDKCTSYNNFINTWLSVFDEIANKYKCILTKERDAYRHYKQFIEKTSKTKLKYYWKYKNLGHVQFADGNEQLSARYKSLRECAEDIYYINTLSREMYHDDDIAFRVIETDPETRNTFIYRCKLSDIMQYLSTDNESFILNNKICSYNEDTRESITEENKFRSINESKAINASDLYPVYITLFSNDTPFGKLIRKVTKSDYSHATIALDPTMNNMYSFSSVPFSYKGSQKMGFVRESLWSPMFKDNRFFTVLVTFVDKEAEQNIEDKINYFRDHFEKFKYNKLGLIEYYAHFKETKGHNEEKKNRWFCSEFVSYMCKAGNIQGFENIMLSPSDITEINNPNVFNIGNYTISNFKESDLVKKTEIARKKFIKNMNNNIVTESFDFEYCDIIEEFSLKNLIKIRNEEFDEKEINKYTALLDWKFLYDKFVKLFPNTNPNVRFDLFELIIRKGLIPFKQSVQNATKDIYDQILNIFSTIGNSIIASVDLVLGLINVNKNNKKLTYKYPELNKASESVVYNNILTEKNIMIPKGYLDDGGVILSDDILQNFININPEILDTKRLERVRNLQELQSYFNDIVSEYNSTIDKSDYYNASISALSYTAYENKINKSNKSVWGYLIDESLTDNQLIEYIQDRLNELNKIVEILNKMLIENIAWFGLSVADVNNIINEPNNSIRISKLKKEIDKREKSITTKTKNSILYDFSSINGGKVIINNVVFNEAADLGINIKPSRYLIRSTIYDLIIVTHNKESGINNNSKWKISNIDIDGKTYDNIYDVLKYVNKNFDKKILLLICNTGKVDLGKYPEFRNMDIRYIDNMNNDRDDNSLLSIFENNLKYKYDVKDYLKIWDDYSDNLFYINRENKKTITEFIDKIDILLPPEKMEYLKHDKFKVSINTKKCKTVTEYKHFWLGLFYNIFNIIDNLVFREKIAYKNYMRHVNNYKLSESNYFWGSKQVLTCGFGNIVLDTRYNTIDECIDDIILYDNIKGVVFNGIYSIYDSNNEQVKIIKQKEIYENYCNIFNSIDTESKL